MNEQEKLNAICFWLIEQCAKTNATTMTVTQENVTKLGENLGDWEIIVKKK